MTRRDLFRRLSLSPAVAALAVWQPDPDAPAPARARRGTMTPADLARFDALRQLGVVDQQAHRDEILPLFEQFWRSEPDRETFARYTNRLMLMPEMLYIMARPSGFPRA